MSSMQMFRHPVCDLLMRTSRCAIRFPQKAGDHVIGLHTGKPSAFAQSSRHVMKTACSLSHCWCEESRKKTAEKAEKLKAFGTENKISKYDPLDRQHVSTMYIGRMVCPRTGPPVRIQTHLWQTQMKEVGGSAGCVYCEVHDTSSERSLSRVSTSRLSGIRGICRLYEKVP